MSRENLRLNYALIVLLVVLAISLTGCLSLLQDVTADADDIEGTEAKVGPNETIETQIQEEQIEDEDVGTDVSTGVSSDAIRTRYDPDRERVGVALTQDVEADYLLVDFGGESTALARLNEAGDRAVLTRNSFHVGGEAEDLTRELYAGQLGEGGVGGLSGVEYGEEVEITVRAVEGGVEEVVHEESRVLGHGEVNAKVEYLFDSTENTVRVVLAENVNADYVDVDVTMPGSGTISKFRLHEVGDEARIYADRPGVETYGAAEDLIHEGLTQAVENREEHRSGELTFDELVEQASESEEKHNIFRKLSNTGRPDVDVASVLGSADEVSDIRDELQRTENRLGRNSIGDQEKRRLTHRAQLLRRMVRELTYTEAEELTLPEVNGLFLKYNGQVSEPDDINEYVDVLEEDVFGSDLEVTGTNVDTIDSSTVEGQYETPARDELVNIQAVAHIEPRNTDSGLQTRGGLETTVLDATGEIRSGGYVEVGEETEEEEESIELPSESTDYGELGENESAAASLNTDRVADLVHDSLSQKRAEESLVSQEFETSYQLQRSAQELSGTLLNNIREEDELGSLRSGEAPAQPTQRNTATRHIRNGAKECQTGSFTFRYGEGSPAMLSLDATDGGASVEGEVERAGITSTRINADFASPVTVPNYALPLVGTSSWRGTDNVEAFVYEDLADEGATEQEVANAIVDRLTSNDAYMGTTTDTSYNHQGIGVSVDDQTGVIYVTQSVC